MLPRIAATLTTLALIGPAFADGRVPFRSPKTITDEALACVAASKKLDDKDARAKAKADCRAKRAAAIAEYRQQKARHKLTRSAYKARVKKTLRECRSAKKPMDQSKVKAWESGLAKWTAAIERYLKEGGDAPAATPPELAADLCR